MYPVRPSAEKYDAGLLKGLCPQAVTLISAGTWDRRCHLLWIIDCVWSVLCVCVCVCLERERERERQGERETGREREMYSVEQKVSTCHTSAKYAAWKKWRRKFCKNTAPQQRRVKEQYKLQSKNFAGKVQCRTKKEITETFWFNLGEIWRYWLSNGNKPKKPFTHFGSSLCGANILSYNRSTKLWKLWAYNSNTAQELFSPEWDAKRRYWVKNPTQWLS
jgi:hypothetical protein